MSSQEEEKPGAGDWLVSIYRVESRLQSNFTDQREAQDYGAAVCNKYRRMEPNQEFWFDIEQVKEKEENK